MTLLTLPHPRLLALLVAGAVALPCAQAQDALTAGFANPPNSAKPRVWWHWLNGNITQTGIKQDLEWMSRIGIGGMQNFDAALQTPQVVERRLAYMTPEWKDAFKYSATLAASLDLEMGIAASPGWSETGGPWVAPADGMKKLVWSETVIGGGKRFKGKLPRPPSVTGPYQDVPRPPPFMDTSKPKKLPEVYADVGLYALPVGAPSGARKPRISVGGKALDAALLMDRGWTRTVEVPGGSPERPTIIHFAYDQPQTIRSATLYLPGAVSMFFGTPIHPVLEASTDGKQWTKVAEVALAGVPTTVSFAAVSARQFRLVLNVKPANVPELFTPGPGIAGTGFGGPGGNPPLKLAEASLSSQARVNRAEVKAGFAMADDYYVLDRDTPDEPGSAPDAVIDLSGKLAADGSLDWTPPPGRWKLIRFGYSLTGTENHPATPEATGLEVDKYDGAAVRNYMQTYLDMYAGTVGPDLIGKQGLRALVVDSTEVGASNWTPRFLAQFQRLRGYDPARWMPVLAGEIVGSRKQSDAFLYDVRRTLAELTATEHYGVVAEMARARGLTVYTEALEGGRVSLGDDMAMRRFADIPMSAMWTFKNEATMNKVNLADMRGAASVAHVYGQKLVAAESLTSAFTPWAYGPADLRPMIDLEFVSGINRPVIHTSVHQPSDDKKPGLSLEMFGQYFNRHETWADMAKPWIDYLARSSYLLQQGRFVADVAYFYGEDAPLVGLYQTTPVADAPSRYAYDFVNAEIVLDKLSVRDQRLVADSGASYRVLYLGGSSRTMTLAMLQRLKALASAGATIVGPAPTATPALMDDAASFQALVAELWAPGATRAVGQGRVIDSTNIEAVLSSLQIAPDFSVAPAAANIQFLHRQMEDGDLYFLTNRGGASGQTELRFRASGKKPAIWRADTGQILPVSYRVEGGQTVVTMDVAAQDAFFVVFREPLLAQSAEVKAKAYATAATLDQGWDVSFKGLAAPAPFHMRELRSLSESADPAVKYFSGTTTYRSHFELGAGGQGKPLLLDLGKLSDVAHIFVNGKDAGYAWRAPYTVDIGALVQPGRNAVEIQVANLWVNRLIGDAQPGASKVAFTTLPTYLPEAVLRPAGLMGPVVVRAEKSDADAGMKP
ncbi:glycosyl hydrolase [Duganella radicis]|uniref:Glycoside hydrolase n=1 Tax=Duganella radicis TaxID=551988 RepID=A0A6L6PFD1_9BURK|nr:glycosyl hydrolase [Duganella radicis]MTV36995.1 glycoside hydrolase [Duganella radicis]